MSLRVSRGDLRALSGALTEISAGVSKIGSLSRVVGRLLCGHMWTLNSLTLLYVTSLLDSFRLGTFAHGFMMLPLV